MKLNNVKQFLMLFFICMVIFIVGCVLDFSGILGFICVYLSIVGMVIGIIGACKKSKYTTEFFLKLLDLLTWL